MFCFYAKNATSHTHTLLQGINKSMRKESSQHSLHGIYGNEEIACTNMVQIARYFPAEANLLLQHTAKDILRPRLMLLINNTFY